jgi:hypothetical protein
MCPLVPMFSPATMESGVLAWLTDESLYSLCSRMHVLHGHRLPAETARLLFGAPRAGLQHDFPSHLDAFVAATVGQLGDVGSICRERTILKFYRRFIDREMEAEVCATMQYGPVAHLKYRLGLLTSRFGARHPLKACPACVNRDMDEVGWAYWHLRHQLPGCWVCTTHNLPLIDVPIKANGVQRFGWFLPTPRLLKWSSMAEKRLDDIAVSALFRFAELGENLVDAPSDYRVGRRTLHATYRRALERRGLASTGGNVRMAEASEALFEHVQPLRHVLELAAFPASPDQARAQLTRLLASGRGSAHPLRHLMMIDWLFGSIDAFNAFQATNLGTSHVDDRRRPELDAAGARDLVASSMIADLITREGLSVRTVAHRLGISIKTAMVLATRAGIQVQRRGKKLKPEVLRKMTQSLRCGDPKETVAAQYGVSVTTVTTTLQTVPGLAEQWHLAVQERRRQRARDEWLTALSSLGHLGVTVMRREVGAAYAWLYRNDSSWLRQHQPAMVERESPRSRLNWDARDTALSSEVVRAALVLRRQLGSAKLKLWHIYQAVPELRAKSRKLDRLPLTTRAVRVALTEAAPTAGLFDGDS